MSILNRLKEDLKVKFFTETKCKIRFIYVGVNCKRKKWGKKMEIMTILNFHFDYFKTSLMKILQLKRIVAFGRGSGPDWEIRSEN